MKFRYSYIYGLFVLSFGILTALSAMFYRKLMEARASSDELNRNYQSLFLLGKIDAQVKDVVNSETAFIITHDSSVLSSYESLIAGINQELDALQPLLSNTSQQLNLIRLKTLVNNRLLDSRTTVSKVANGYDSKEISTRVLQGKITMTDYQQLLDKMQAIEMNLRAESDSVKAVQQRTVPTFMYSTFLFSAVSLIISFFFIIRELKKRLDFQAKLQQQVGSLNRANAELEQLTHIASHHLQEPLRKIQTFSNQITSRHKDLSPEVTMLLEKINHTGRHMHELMRDMARYSTLINTKETLLFTDLNYILMKVAESMDEQLTLHRGQLIIANTLPVIKGIPSQLLLLFEQLVDNSIKFSKADTPPVITISFESVAGNKISRTFKSLLGSIMYYKISISDNGMGFDNKYIDKMFYLFQKLETHQHFMQSKGIGLPMVQRIMINHGGTVSAVGVAGAGATFTLYFPEPIQ